MVNFLKMVFHLYIAEDTWKYVLWNLKRKYKLKLIFQDTTILQSLSFMLFLFINKEFFDLHNNQSDCSHSSVTRFLKVGSKF